MKVKLKDIKFHGQWYGSSICKFTIPMPDHSYTDLKSRKTIYKGGIKKERIVPCCWKYSGVVDAPELVTFEFYAIRKQVEGKEIKGTFETEREALKAIDLFLIRNNKEPKYIMKSK
jgi:isocitrate/isopropylmalate dehydrogenase